MIKSNLRINFKTAQKEFDKWFRALKRRYKNKDLNDLGKLAADNSPKIWEKLKSLNNPVKPRAALEIVRSDNTISRDIKEVLERWHNDIAKLFSGVKENPDVIFDDLFYDQIIAKKVEFENLANDDDSSYVVNYFNSDELNYEISHEEVSKAIDAAKNGKAFLEIPNDALKNDNAKLLLSKFFNLCFQSGVSPTGWSFSNIIPIPKPEKDQRDPLKRGA